MNDYPKYHRFKTTNKSNSMSKTNGKISYAMSTMCSKNKHCAQYNDDIGCVIRAVPMHWNKYKRESYSYLYRIIRIRLRGDYVCVVLQECCCLLLMLCAAALLILFISLSVFDVSKTVQFVRIVLRVGNHTFFSL